MMKANQWISIWRSIFFTGTFTIEPSFSQFIRSLYTDPSAGNYIYSMKKDAPSRAGASTGGVQFIRPFPQFIQKPAAAARQPAAVR